MLSKVSFAAAVFASVASAEQEFVTPADDFRELQKVPIAFPSYYGWRYGYCRMQANPAYPTTNPWGFFKLREQGWWAPMEIKGFMFSMPPSASQHGFSINTNLFDRRDCRSTEPTWDPYNQPYGQMNSWPSQVGDLDPVVDNTSGFAWYNEVAW